MKWTLLCYDRHKPDILNKLLGLVFGTKRGTTEVCSNGFILKPEIIRQSRVRNQQTVISKEIQKQSPVNRQGSSTKTDGRRHSYGNTENGKKQGYGLNTRNQSEH